MPIELKKKIIKTLRSIPATGTDAYFDKDIIVPDTQPDIKTVLQCELLPMICEKHIQRDYIILSGNLDYSIIYLGEDGSIKSISTRVPFTHQIEARGAQVADFAGVKADVMNVEFNAVNSRKINVKCRVDFESNIICTEEFEAVCGAECDGDLPCKAAAVSSFSLKAYAENEFELSDTLMINSKSEMIDSILKVDTSIGGKEIKSISGKLVAKGILQIKALYCDTAGQIQSTESSVPFTEVLSIDDVWDDNICECEYSLTDLTYSIAADSDGDLGLIEVKASINAATNVFEKEESLITADLYSPDFDISVARDKAKVSALANYTAEKLAVKDTITFAANEPPITKTYNVIVKPYVESAEINGNKAKVCGVADVYIEYISDFTDAPICSCKGEIPFSFDMDAPCGKDAQISVICEAEDIAFNTTSSGTVDVRFNLNVDGKIIEDVDVSYIKDAESSEEKLDKSNMPSIVIYFAAKGEKMWDIAKRYHTTESAICAANGCEFGDVLTEPKKIMIPR